VFSRDIVCLRNISINTLHKGDDDDDDDDGDNNKSRATTNVLSEYELIIYQMPEFIWIVFNAFSAAQIEEDVKWLNVE